LSLAGVLPIEIRSQPACVICAEPAPKAASLWCGRFTL